MSVDISTDDERRGVHYRLTCDGEHGLGPPPMFETIVVAGEPWSAHQARDRGWRIGVYRDLCPDCARHAGR